MKLVTLSMQYHEDNYRELRAAFKRLRESEIQRLYYIKGERLFGDDGEGTVDGSHPSDLGFVRQAGRARTSAEKAPQTVRSLDAGRRIMSNDLSSMEPARKLG